MSSEKSPHLRRNENFNLSENSYLAHSYLKASTFKRKKVKPGKENRKCEQNFRSKVKSDLDFRFEVNIDASKRT